MIEYILKRILLFIPTLLAITLITFGISRLAPGDPAEMKAGIGQEGTMAAGGKMQVNEETIKLIRHMWHLDEPIWKQYVLWMNDMVHLDFGNSFIDQRPVMSKIMERLPITFTLSLISVILVYIIAIPIGIYSASHQYSTGDKISGGFLFMLYSLPDFWIATMAIIFLCGGDYLALFPSSGIYSMDYSSSWSFLDKILDIGWHIVLPVIMYTYAGLAYISRQMRGSMLEVIRQDYIRTARAKGLDERKVIYKHALRNSLIPIITLLAGLLPSLIGGSIVIETIFSIPGIGQLGFQALLERDYPMIMAELTIGAVLTLLGILISDILYSVVDPRIVFSKKTV
ncbi:MAG TPA: ABC transporter permease [Candidatus Kapabacteria bacterium]|nr:ABC transporter permease [Candidatus Kapabacteria bacterium]